MSLSHLGAALSLCVLGLLAPGSLWAGQYFVDAVHGDDHADGRQPKTLGTSGPWRTLRRSVAEIRAGDVLVLACGSVWSERLILRGGSSGRPVTVTAPISGCGSAERPMVQPRESVPFSYKNDAWFAPQHIQDVARVFIDGRELSPTLYGGEPWLRLDAGQSWGIRRSGTDRVVAPELVKRLGRALVGATIALRTTPYRVELRRIQKVEDDRALWLDKPTHYPVSSATEYYVTHAAKTGSRGWARTDSGISLLGTKTVGHAEVVRALPAVEITGTVRLSGFDVSDAGAEGILVRGGRGSELRDIRIRHAALDAVVIRESPGSLVEGLEIEGSGRDGIRLEQSDDTTVYRNTIIDTAMAGPPVDSFAVINAETSNRVTIEGNRIKRAAYLGIRFKRQSKVVRNLLEETCRRLPDCGAIYAWARLDPDPPFASEVQGNVIRSVGLQEQPKDEAPSVATGIYLDDLASGITVEDNVVTGAPQGVFLHNSIANLVRGNTLFKNDDCEVCMVAGMSREVSERMGSTEILENDLVTAQSGVAYRLYSRFGTPDWKRFERNRVHAGKGQAVALISPGKYAKTNGRVMDVVEWNRRLSVPDIVSISDNTDSVSTSLKSVTGKVGQSLNESWLAWSETHAAVLSRAGCEVPACIGFKLNKGELGRLVSTYLQPSVASRLSLVFSARAEGGDNSVRVEVRGGKPPYALLTDLGLVRLGADWRSFSLDGVLQVPVKEQARVHFVADGPAWFSVRNVMAHRGDKAKSSSPILLLNDGVNPRSFSCADNGPEFDCVNARDIRGDQVTWPIVVPPMTARVLVLGTHQASNVR